jgi:hypothetical protein
MGGAGATPIPNLGISPGFPASREKRVFVLGERALFDEKIRCINSLS